MSTKTKMEALEQIRRDIEQDGVTPELRETATQLVLGEGSPDSQVLFVGEAPGKNEDLQGRPFVGAAGQFLNEMLAGAGMKREEVYITNIVKYRPPANRDPSPEEIEAFVPYLRKQMEVIRPPLVVFLGRHAMSVFLPGLRISQAHGRPVRKDGQVYLPLFHPAAALYNGGMRETLTQDFALIPVILKKLEQGPASNIAS
jgi:uracil-DNA glycosylase family 4